MEEVATKRKVMKRQTHKKSGNENLTQSRGQKSCLIGEKVVGK